MIVPPQDATGMQIALLRSVGYAAFRQHERELDVLDVVFDSLVDAPGSEDSRRLRFAGHGLTLDVEVHGLSDLTIELRTSVPGPFVVEPRGSECSGPAHLVSFLLRWPAGTQRPVRTAWIVL